MAGAAQRLLPWLAAALLLRWAVSLHFYSGETIGVGVRRAISIPPAYLGPGSCRRPLPLPPPAVAVQA